MNGINTPQRTNFYLKYKKSGIFDDEDPIADKSQDVAMKVNKLKCAYKFKPRYEEMKARDRYLKQYWDIDIKKKQQSNNSNKANKTQNDSNSITPLKKLLTEYSNSKENEKEESKGYSTRRQYIKEFFTNNVFEDSYTDIKQNSMRLNRSKSFFQARSIRNIVFEDDEDNDNINTYNKNQLQKIEALASNIFNIKEKENIVLNKGEANQSLSTSSGDTTPFNMMPITMSNQTKIEKSKIPSVFDWRYSNTELGTRNHIIRSKTIDPVIRKQKDLMSHFDDEEDKKQDLIQSNCKIVHRNNREMFLPVYATKSIDIRPNRNLLPSRLPDDKEIAQYELIAREHFDTVDCNKIKRMFMSNGIHMFNFEDNGAIDGFQSGKMSFKIRKDKNDQDIDKKMHWINEEVKSLGLKMNKIVKDTHIKKERRPTPGTELLKNAKKKIVFAKDKCRNMKPQCDIGYKNFVAFKKNKVK